MTARPWEKDPIIAKADKTSQPWLADEIVTAAKPASPQDAKPNTGFIDDLVRTAGRGVRSAAVGMSGVLDLAAAPGKAATAALAIGADAIGADQAAGFLTQGATAAPMSELTRQAIDTVTGDQLQPQNDIEKFTDSLVEFVVPGVAVGKAAQAIPAGAGAVAQGLKEAGKLETLAEKAALIGGAVGNGLADVFAPDSTAAHILLPILGGAGALATVKSPEIANSALQTAARGAKATGQAVQKAANATAAKIKEADLPKLVQKLPPEERMIYEVIKSEGLDTRQAIDIMVEARNAGLGIPTYQALDSPTLRAMAKSLAEFGGGAKTARETIKELTETKIPDAITGMIGQIAGNKLSANENAQVLINYSNDLLAKATEKLKFQAKPLYDATVTAENLIPQAQFDAIKNLPVFQTAAQRVLQKPTMRQLLGVTEGQLADGSMLTQVATPKNSMKFLHAVRAELGNMIDTAGKRGGTADRKIITETKNMLTSFMDESYPLYAEARGIFSDDLAEVKALQSGPLAAIRDISATDAQKASETMFAQTPETIAQLRKLFTESGMDGGQEAWDRGVQAFLQQKFEATRDGRIKGFRDAVFGDEIARRKFKAAVPAHYQRLDKFFELLDQANQASRIGGSDTASKQAAQAYMGDGFTTLEDVALLASSPQAGALNFFRRAYQDTVIKDPAGAQRLSQFLFTPEGEDFLRKVAKIQDMEK